MGWSIGYDSRWKRDIGYGVPAYCDHPDCTAEIDRGLAHVCANEEPYGGDDGCGLYFCAKHLRFGCCERCYEWLDDDLKPKKHGPPPFDAKPDHPTWLRHKLRHASWAQWRKENPAEVAAIRKALRVRAALAPRQTTEGHEP